MRQRPAATLTLLLGTQAAATSLGVGLQYTSTTWTQSGFYPPDTMGATGPDHVVVLVNGRYVVHRKSDGAVVESTSLDGFWTQAGQSPTSYSFDPRVLYDAPSQRWFAASVDNAEAPNSYLVAVSKTSDPTDGWTGFKVASDSTAQAWAGFPTMGVDGDGVYVVGTMFPVGSDGLPTATSVLVIPKADLVAATPSIANLTYFENTSVVGF